MRAVALASVVEALGSLPLSHGQAALAALGQSGFAICLAGRTVLVDPFLSPDPNRLVPADESIDRVRAIDVVACTHEHRDHLDLPVLPALLAGSPGAVLVVPEPVVPIVVDAGIPAARVWAAQPGRSIRFGTLEIAAVPARHGVRVADAYSFGTEVSGGLVRYLGYVLRGDGVAVYHAGDTILDERIVDAVRPFDVDVALLPINGRDAEREALGLVGNLDAEEAVQVAAAVGAKLLIPMHYDMFARNPGRPEDVVAHSRSNGHGFSVAVPAIGRPVIVAGSLVVRSNADPPAGSGQA